MSELIKKYFYREIDDNRYREISEKIYQPIDLFKLPLYGEKEIVKQTSDRYGKIKIKLDIENDEKLIEDINKRKKTVKFYNNSLELNNDKRNLFTYRNFFTYKWEVNENKLPKSHFEHIIKSKIEDFIQLLYNYNKSSNLILRFSVIDGEQKVHERPIHEICTEYALIEIFKQL